MNEHFVVEKGLQIDEGCNDTITNGTSKMLEGFGIFEGDIV